MACKACVKKKYRAIADLALVNQSTEDGLRDSQVKERTSEIEYYLERLENENNELIRIMNEKCPECPNE